MIDATLFEYLAKAVGVIGSILGLFKFLPELDRKPKLREEYKFAKEFIADMRATSAPHPYLIEKGFAAVSGENDLSASEILYLLAQPNPSKSLKIYASARRIYLEYSEDAHRIDFTNQYFNEKRRKWVKRINFVGYFFFAFIAVMPVFFISNIFGENWQKVIVYVVITSLSSGYIAISCVLKLVRIENAEKLVGSQRPASSNP